MLEGVGGDPLLEGAGEAAVGVWFYGAAEAAFDVLGGGEEVRLWTPGDGK